MNVIREGGKNIIFDNPSLPAIKEMALQKNVEVVESLPDIIDLSKN